MKWFWIALGSIAYWVAAFFGMLLVAMAHGDCWAGTTRAEAMVCADQKSVLIFIYIASVIAIFAGGLVFALRRN